MCLNEENAKHFSSFGLFFIILYRIVLLESNSVRAPPVDLNLIFQINLGGYFYEYVR
jgi:hypothetical protein